jgi:hypothetical protein
MFWDAPEGHVPTEAERDMHARWLPEPAAIDRAVTALAAAEPGCTLAIVAMAQPGKTRGFWEVGQEVETVPELVWLCGEDNLFEATGAAEVAARAWLGDRPGTTAYAIVMRDGTAAVFEGWH